MTAGTTAPASEPCATCGEPVGAADSFCEACGAELAPMLISDGESTRPGRCSSCRSAGITADGYCEACGRRVPGGRDHAELDLGCLAGVTDRGLRHHRNEDAMALAVASTEAGPVLVAVVCDGVSSSARADEASLVAARAAARVLLTAARTGADPLVASPQAVQAAVAAVAGLTGPPGDAPATTFVSAVLTGEAVTVCWLGDSRAYWLAAGPGPAPERLTTDDSVAEEMVAAGIDAAQAQASAQAHVVTRWIGADLSDPAPHVRRFEPPGAGALLLCSDGLWNYQPDAAGLAGLALPAALTNPLAAARALAGFAARRRRGRQRDRGPGAFPARSGPRPRAGLTLIPCRGEHPDEPA